MRLPNVTLIAYTSKNIEGHRKALEYSSKDIEFGAVKLIEDRTMQNIDDWNRAIIYALPKHIETDFALLIHDDGFVVNPESWRPEFFDHDYVGAPWPLPTDSYSYRDIHGNIIRAGNSVSLRSKKLLDLAPKLNLEWKSYYGNTNEDGFITCHNRHIYKANGCKFADIDVAKYFSRETPLPENEGIKPFVFHRYAGENAHYPKFK